MRCADTFAVIQRFIVVVMTISAGIERGNARLEIFAFVFRMTTRAGNSGSYMRLRI